MKSPNTRRAALVSLSALTAGLSACATSPATPPSAEQAVTINFAARVGDKPARCGESYPGVGTSGATIMLQDFRIYVSEVRLLAADGREVPLKLTPDNQWQNDKVALLDFENATGNCNGNAPMNTAIRGTAPAGQYKGVVFEIGVPYELNHKDPTLAAPPLNYSGLTWPWRIGYKFTTIDFDTANKPAMASQQTSSMPGMAASGFSIHLGSTDCGAGSPTTPPTAPCTNPNRPTYRLESFDFKSGKAVLDLGELLAVTDVTVNAPNSASGCMSFTNDDDCVAIMDRLGLSFRGKPSAGQHFVKAG
jgi:uncharacterized repeat protein (TIGR04052 family)